MEHKKLGQIHTCVCVSVCVYGSLELRAESERER